MAQQPLSEASDTDTEMRHYSFDQESDSGDHDESAGEDRRTRSVQKATWVFSDLRFGCCWNSGKTNHDCYSEHCFC